MQRALFLFLFLLSLLPFSSSLLNAQYKALEGIVKKWNLHSPDWKLNETCDSTRDWRKANDKFWVNCTCVRPKDVNDCNITGLKIYGWNVTEMPQELFNLTELTYLNLSHNLLSGSIPPNTSHLTHLEQLDLSVNNLSGSISPVSNLTKLTFLGLSVNMLSGNLPQFENLMSLEHLYIDSNQFDGALELEKLENLKTLWAFDNSFTGKFPDSVWNLTNLTDLRIYGTSLQVGTPKSYSSLKNLVTLMLGDLQGHGFTLSFLNQMTLTSLKTLSVRNSDVTGDLSSYLQIFNKSSDLTNLDLSFNKLTGLINTSAMKDFKSLKQLFLGNNSLKGEINLQDIPQTWTALDVSFNDIHVNSSQSDKLFRNYLGTSNFSDNSYKGLGNCLHAFLCTTNNFTDSFAINCGGENVSNSGIPFHNDTAPLGAAGFYIDPLNNQWAVSNVGYDGSTSGGSSGIVSVNASIDKAEGSMALYQTARVSTSSLRYYVGGLKNGSYIIELHFAEIVINASDVSWESRGRRVFDVFIQNSRVLTDFNIINEAQGSFIACKRNFTANVTNGELDIHLFWAGKGTFAIPRNYTYGPLLSAINISSVHEQGGDAPPPPSSHKSSSKRAGIITGIAAICIATLLILSSIGYLWWKRINLGHIKLTDAAMKG